jgi:hypothetical protein
VPVSHKVLTLATDTGTPKVLQTIRSATFKKIFGSTLRIGEF